ncbi:MAG: glycosyltransferase family 4 protein [Gammaproteobacteria bacterium]|nr:glycosyltransferase family 4 protein [Gammaproteobacteria bacterium]
MGAPQVATQASLRPRIIVLISTRIIGGPAKGLLQVIPDLLRRRFDVMVCTFAGIKETPSPFMRACAERRIPLHILRQRFHFDWSPLQEIVGLLDVPQAVIQTHGYKEAVFGLLARRASGKPWIAFQHGTTQENMKVRLYHRLDRRVTCHADAIVAVSRELADRQVAASVRERLCIIENAIDRRPQGTTGKRPAHGPWPAGGPVIGCIGRLSPEKGHAQLIAAARRLAAQGGAFTIVCAGDGAGRRRLESLVAAAGLQARVRFLGQVARVDEVYATLDMLVVPSLKEGMPNVVLEAMQLGLPIVSTRVGAIPEMITDGVSGLLVPAGDVSALADAMAKLMRDPDGARALGQRARAVLYPRFAPEQRLARFEELYGRVLEMT